jgi:CBS domain-containing protein
MNATDIMTPDVIYAAPDTPLRDLVRLMLDNHVSALPIVEYGRIVGIVSEGDLFRRVEIGTDPRPSAWQALVRSTDRLAADYTRTHGQKASELMTRNVVTVSDTTLLEEVALLLDTKHVKRVPVTHDGKLVGIVSRRNLLQALASRLSAPSVTAEDRSIREAFYQALREQPWAVGVRAINAMVADGVVRLWGTPPDDALRQAIIVVAENLAGVQSVEDHMDRPSVVDPLNLPNWPAPAPP